MNKTKRTLFISSLVMILALIVTVVSVSAAWFSNSTSTRKDGLIIDSDTLREFASIDYDADAQPEGGLGLWPAIATNGWLLQSTSSNHIAPTGQILKNADASKGIKTGAKCATAYFPIRFEGSGDSSQADGRKSLKLNVLNASIASYRQTAEDGKETILKDFKGEFNFELSLVSVTGTGEDAQITEIELGNADSLEDNQIYFNQPTDAQGEPGYNLYMLIKPGVDYYVRAVIYFNKIDEECNHELFYQTVTFTFTLEMLTVGQDGVDIRAGKYGE